jgi:hypothetical protein
MNEQKSLHHIDNVIQGCVAVICTLSRKGVLQEFELFAYEQACNVFSSYMKFMDFQFKYPLGDDEDAEFGDYTR